jgi:hypothetical protein
VQQLFGGIDHDYDTDLYRTDCDPEYDNHDHRDSKCCCECGAFGINGQPGQ